ncbi:hypothetical protein KDU71_22280 [Carboxylicivirga sediminis]|uniref:Uncharacterized protein n=1 Tax=Carboxylicivirga sediminis TaxID=2006564 RepID=A0A941FD47_9BACT|nr:hypothetical protein [Carboxylicivirga sediminis]MBR8538315.1 hypothetical protein [Carboxylicivirga sediminis]
MDKLLRDVDMQKLLEKYAGNIAILEEKIDVQLQLQYFKESKQQKKELDKEQVLTQKEKLFDPDYSLEEKKLLMCQLASVNEVEAYRMLEAYKANPDKALVDWSILAYQESKMLLQSTLLDEKPLFISTGLGGKGNKLRYFVVLFTNEQQVFSQYQEQLVKGEVEYAFRKNSAEIEELEFCGYYMTIQALVPLDCGLKNMLAKIIKQCNELGDFLSPSLLVTNVKKLSLGEIEKLIDQQQSNQNINKNGIEE